MKPIFTSYLKERTSFFEKKEAKKLYTLARALRLARAQTCKSFLVLFFKKEHPFLSPVMQGKPIRRETVGAGQAAAVFGH
jgi:hypothetical protein